jgi:hypothetical protein
MKKNLLRSLTTLAFVAFLSTAFAKEPPLIFPVPQELRSTKDFFNMDEKVQIVLTPNATQKDINLSKLLIRELSVKYGLALKAKSV